jgi:phage tail-like protein
MQGYTRRAKDPFLSFRFHVEIGNLKVGEFTEVTGLQAEVEVFEYREGGGNDFVHKLAGPVRYPSNLVLKHGLMDANQIWQWEQQILEGTISRTNITIVLKDETGQDRWRWKFKDAYPVKWSGPDLRAGTAEVAIETLELAHRGFILADSGLKR